MSGPTKETREWQKFARLSEKELWNHKPAFTKNWKEGK